jgi:hypothetical protein
LKILQQAIKNIRHHFTSLHLLRTSLHQGTLLKPFAALHKKVWSWRETWFRYLEKHQKSEREFTNFSEKSFLMFGVGSVGPEIWGLALEGLSPHWKQLVGTEVIADGFTATH